LTFASFDDKARQEATKELRVALSHQLLLISFWTHGADCCGLLKLQVKGGATAHPKTVLPTQQSGNTALLCVLSWKKRGIPVGKR